MNKLSVNRHSGLDILRLLAMFGIVTLHILGHGGLLKMTDGSITGSLLWGLESVSYLSVNIFVLITGFFMCESLFKLQKVFRLILDITFWALVCFAVFTMTADTISIKAFIKSIVGWAVGLYWFPTVYLALYIISPFLNILSKQLQRVQFIWLLLATVILATLPFLSSAIGIGGMSLPWFVVLYLTGTYLRRYPPSAKGVWIIGLVLSVGILWAVKVVPISLLQTYGGLLWGYNSIVCWFGSVCAFQVFRGISVRSRSVSVAISFLASSTFGVYLIHDNEYIRGILWKTVRGLFSLVPSGSLIPKTLLAVFCVFVVCLILESLRLQLFRLARIDRLLETIAVRIAKTVNTVSQNHHK